MSVTKTGECEIEVSLDDFDIDEIHEYVQRNFEISEVFERSEIHDYVRSEFTIDEIFSDSEIEAQATTAKSPEDLFSEATLADWANRNGWTGPN